MYPSSNSTINICNFIYNNTPIPTSPMQYEDEHVLLQHIHSLLLHQQEEEHNNFQVESAILLNNNNNNSNEQYLDNNNNNNIESWNSSTMMMKNNVVVGKKGGKKCSKKDRHSKIHTAHGPRDRRMRLSLEVARKFFDLQDMLGFDKASKTVDWLLMKSRLAINDLKQHKHCGGAATATASASSTSECEAASGVLDQEFEPPMGGDNIAAADGSKDNNNNKKAKTGRVRAAFNPLAKESRNKARERARERTKMKNMLGETPQQMGGATTNEPQVLPPPAAEEHNWTLSNIFHCHQNPPPTSHQDQFGEFPYSGKFWEGYNNGNL